MKNILIIFFLFLCYNVVAQNNPSGVPTQFSTGWFRHGWDQSDSGKIFTNRNPNFTPRFAGTVEFYQDAGLDSLLHLWTGARWLKLIPGFDSTSMSDRINLKQNQLSNAGVSGDSLYINNAIKRIQNDYGLTFSTNATKILMFVDTLGSNHVVTTSQLKDTAAAIRAAIGGGGSGLTSVGLSMPSAFSVSGSPLTSNGTINVSGAGTTAQYVRGNGTLATTDTGMIPNFYLKVRSLISNISPITYNSTTGEIGINNATTTGTKGAATFASSDFSDNGLGTISLADKVSAGTCVNCQVTYNAKGQATSFANGTPPQFVNASGAGDTLSINDTLKRLNPGFGILHTVTANNITQRVDTSVIATQYDLTQISSSAINNIGAGYRWVATSSGNIKTAFGSNTIAVDSSSNSNALTFKADTSVLATQYDISQLTITAGNGIDITNNKVSQLFMPLKSNTPIVGDSYSKGCCPDGTFTTWVDTLSTAFLGGISVNNLSISGIGVRKGAYQLFNSFGEIHSNTPIGFFVGFNNTRILAVDTATHYATIQAAYRAMVAAQFVTHLEAPNWGASGTNSNVTYSNSSAPASSEDTLLNWQSRLYYFRHNTVNTGANWFNKASCNNDTITIRNMIGGNLFFSTFAYYNSAGSRIKINIDGTDIVTYNPNNRTYTGQAEGFTPDGIIPDAIILTGLTNTVHTAKVIFIDNGKRGALDCFGSLCSAQESYDRPAYILSFPHMTDSGYNYTGGVTTQGILDSATSGLKNSLRQTFPSYAMAFVDINYPNGFYDPGDASQVSADSIHPSNEGQYNIGKSVYTLMLKTDKIGGSTLDAVLTAGNTSSRQILLSGNNTTAPNVRIGGDVDVQVFANSNSWLSSNMYFDGSNFRYTHNGFAQQVYFNSGYLEFKNAASGTTGGVVSVATRFSMTPNGDVWLGGNITNSVSGLGAKLLINGTSGNTQYPAVASIGPTAYTDVFPLRLYAIAGQPAMAMYYASGATDEKIWDITTSANTFNMRMANDAYSAATDWLTVTRTGYTSAKAYFGAGEVNIGNATDQGAYTLQNTGGFYQNGTFLLKPLTAPPSTYNVMVHGLTDSVVYQIPASSLASTTLYSGDGTLAGNRTVTGSSNSLTFNSMFNYRVNGNAFILDGSSTGHPYTFALIGAGNSLEIGFTPTATVYDKGAGLIIDTNNNAGLGSSVPTTAPLYTAGNSTFVNGFQSGRANFLRVDSVVTNTTVNNQEYFFVINAAGGNITMTLPAASTVFGSGMGVEYMFKRIDNSGNTVTVQVNGSTADLIDGASSFTIVGQYTMKAVQCGSATNWWVR